MDRIISSFRKAVLGPVIGFSVCIILLAVAAYINGVNVAPTDMFTVTWMFLSLVIISTVVSLLEGWRLWAGLPYWLKRVLSMPLYLTVCMAGLMNISIAGEQIRIRGSVIIALFGIAYVIGSVISYFVSKKETDKMNDALLLIQKEIEKDDE